MDDTMTLTVERTSDKYGPSFMAKETGDQTWFRPSKFDAQAVGPAIAGLRRGDTIEAVVAQGKFVKSLRVVSSGAAPTPSNGGSTGPSEPSAKDAQIARSTAVKAVLQSPMLATQWKDLDAPQAVAEAKTLIGLFEKYILTGGF